ncbi:helix-turn-helix domain-containing protein [Nonomuraea jabiensis]|uniref:Sugar diacid utilization regulator n=1 Tax=Nonomuraea jabiensis TaxID=882448 RepID=A0A7W9GII8_9ACTN|nr:helix-turn-helix domain-containing protein [Nonomuraea jabiensis]MBB5784475.1 sugar diacid utilization regulator [Nonomuraea jabiensis]
MRPAWPSCTPIGVPCACAKAVIRRQPATCSSDHGAALLRTLRTYLDSGLDRHVTARALTLHPNTVSRRLRRVEALTGLDLRSSQAVVDARAALIVLDVAEGADAARHRV